VNVMINRLQVSALLLAIAIAWGVALVLYGVDVRPELFRPFSTVVGVVVVLLVLVDKWLWQCRWLHPWLFHMPNIRGTWRAEITPTAPSTSPAKVEGYVVVTQTLSTISIRLFTAESKSETLSARVYCCDDATFTVAAVYRNVPRITVRDRSPLHHGAMLLSVQGDPPKSLSGEYWTDRLSQGEITLEARISKRVHSFEEAKRAFEA